MHKTLQMSLMPFVVLACLLLWAPDAEPYQRTSGCVDCHSIFFGGWSSEGHTAHLQIGLPQVCFACHEDIGDTPDTITCTSCHVQKGLVKHHVQAASATGNPDIGICSLCHNPFLVDHENNMPPGYTGTCLDTCDGSEELFSLGSFTISLDNDGDLLVDSDDPDCFACLNPTARIAETPLVQYTDLQEAYDLSIDSNTIQMNDIPFPDDIFINANKTIYFDSGYNCSFTSNPGASTIYGDMLISAGGIVIQNGTLILQYPPEDCTDGFDNNGNGLIDCDDPYCADELVCTGPMPEDCSDCTDNDGDGFIDCNDADCGSDSSCTFGECTACHGDPPIDASTLVSLPPGTGSVTAGAHAPHAVTMSYDCENCHSGSVGGGPTHTGSMTITMGFAGFGGSYDGQSTATYDSSEVHTYVSNTGSMTCGTIYCHSNVQSANGTAGPDTFASPMWNASSVACDSCHGQAAETDGQPDSGSHVKHAGSAGENYMCVTCHTGGEGTDAHADGTINMDIDNSFGASAAYNQGSHTPGAGGYGNCLNVYCHGVTLTAGADTTPAWGAALVCGSCHGADAATPPTAGSHERHAGSGVFNVTDQGLGRDCAECHGAGSGSTGHMNKSVAWDLDPALGASATYRGSNSGATGAQAPSASYGTCSTIYCHSNVQSSGGTAGPTLYESPTWGGASVTCDSCHGQDAEETDGQPATGSHDKHAGSQAGEQNYACTTCHSGGGDETSNHADRTINMDIDNVYGVSATYNGDTIPGSGGYSTCSNIFCHSSVQADGGTGEPTAYATPEWGSGAVTCDSCHGQAAETDGQPATGSHAKHTGPQAGALHYDCSACHKNSGYGTEYHADGTINIDIDNIYDDGGTAAYSQGDHTPRINGYGTCSNVICHGSAEAAWGNPESVSCQTCHATGTADVDDFIFGNDAIAQISATEWASVGHGSISTYAGSGNPGADLTSCYYCHDTSAAHGDVGNPFRLLNNAGGDGQNGVCLICHKTGATGYDPDSGGPLPLRVGTLSVDSYHYGPLHGSGNNGGRFCWDCHDPHGDSNISMIHDDVTQQSEGTYGIPSATVPVTFVANSSGVDYAKSSSPYDGICNVCHTSTDHYTASSGDGHNTFVPCVYCHAHTGDDMSQAFAPSEECVACHGDPPITADTGGPNGLVGIPGTTGSTTPGIHALHATAQEWTVNRTYIRYLWPYPNYEIVIEPTLKKGYNFPCETCHEGGMSSEALSLDTNIQIGGSVITYGGVRTLNAPYTIVGTQYSYKGAVPSFDQNDPSRPIVTGDVILSGSDMKCSTYCHSDGGAIFDGIVDTSVKSPAWDAIDSDTESLPCDTCHGYPPENGSIYYSSHVDHVEKWRFTCDKCHFETTEDGVTIANTAKHGDGNVDVTPYPGISEFRYVFSPGGGGSCYALPGGEAAPYVGCHLIDNPDSGIIGVHGPYQWKRIN